MRSLIAAAALLCAAPALAQNEAPLDASDVGAFVERLRQLGYKPSEVEDAGGFPTLNISVDDTSFGMTFGGCTQRKSCTYLSVVGVYSDVRKPPADWVAKENADFDLIKVWVTDEGLLAYSATAMIQGWPVANFRNWLELLKTSGAQLANDAIEAKLDGE